MNTNIKRNSLLKKSSLSIACALLTACGGGSDPDTTIDSTPIQPSGVQLDSSNFQAGFKTSGTSTLQALNELLNAGDEIDLENRTVISQTSTDSTFACDNQGTIQFTSLSADTTEAVFNNCDILTDFSSTKYNGVLTVKTVIASGSASTIGDYAFDWDYTQTASLDNFSQTTPISGGVMIVADGVFVSRSMNNVAGELEADTLTSSDLTLSRTDESGVLITRQFSNLFYDTVVDNPEGISALDLDYTANITGLGDVQLTTLTEFVTANSSDDTLLSGSAQIDTGASIVRLNGTGGDNVDVTIDSNNDGVFEESIATTWTVLTAE